MRAFGRPLPYRTVCGDPAGVAGPQAAASSTLGIPSRGMWGRGLEGGALRDFSPRWAPSTGQTWGPAEAHHLCPCATCHQNKGTSNWGCLYCFCNFSVGFKLFLKLPPQKENKNGGWWGECGCGEGGGQGAKMKKWT